MVQMKGSLLSTLLQSLTKLTIVIKYLDSEYFFFIEMYIQTLKKINLLVLSLIYECCIIYFGKSTRTSACACNKHLVTFVYTCRQAPSREYTTKENNCKR